MTIAEAGASLRSGAVSAVELTQESIRLAYQHERLRAFITLTETEAIQEAQQRDDELRRGQDRGPLHGVPIALKDLICTRGVRTTGGSQIYADFVPHEDAAVARRLRDAGAVFIGKTNLHELAFGITSRNPHFGTVLNARDETLLAGGSSGGSATAVAAGIVAASLGTDTGGSIRIPASYCGVTGLKPTYDLVSRKGVLPLAFSLDHVGPMGSCVADCAQLLRAMTGSTQSAFDPNASLSSVRLGLPRRFFFDAVDREVKAAVQRAAKLAAEQGASVREVDLPDLSEANTAARIIQLAEFAALHTGDHDSSRWGDDVWRLLQQGRVILGHEYVNAQRVRQKFREKFDDLWRQIDVLFTPTTPIAAPKLLAQTVSIEGREEDVRLASTRLVRAMNLLGEPALSLPCGQTEDGRFIGLQMIAAPFADMRLLSWAGAIEQTLA